MSNFVRTHPKIGRRLLNERVSAFFVRVKHAGINTFFPERILFAFTTVKFNLVRRPWVVLFKGRFLLSLDWSGLGMGFMRFLG